MKLLKYLFQKQESDGLVGGKTMEQLQREYDIRTRREKMRKYPERYRNSGDMRLVFE